MNPEFQLVEQEDKVYVQFRSEAIAVFSESNQPRLDSRTLKQRAAEYIHKYGYMAEWRRRWLTGDKCSWSEDLRVVS